ncbi:MAG: hypothetical protein CVU04_04625 [Bacteroidetes bacterium HGW-Bacteroidetes-20]|nr:MAG: hypothetical protein CVU04_04625 [Bacteroidetes bacterium HGW-Bacteroidetes-20]
MKRKIKIFYLFEILVSVCILSCNTKTSDFVKTQRPIYSKNGGILKYDTILKSNPYFQEINKNGKYYLYYETGEIKEMAEFRNDTLINENVLYSKTGNEISYRFYNLDGECMFFQEISEYNLVIGDLFFDPFMYFKFPHVPNLNDTIPIEVYIATPAGVNHELLGVYNDSIIYDLNYEKVKPYCYVIKYTPNKKGINVLSLKLEYYDSLVSFKLNPPKVAKYEFYHNLSFNISE